MHIKTALLMSTTFLKITALAIAYFLWSMLGDLYNIQATYVVPICFQSSDKYRIKEAPKRADITLYGSRQKIRSIDPQALSVTIDPLKLTPGRNVVAITHKHLGLPSCINVINYNPTNFTVIAEPIQPIAPEAKETEKSDSIPASDKKMLETV